jgi:hypothetical protein
MENNVWIRLTFITASQLEGQDEFVEELKEICIVQTANDYGDSGFDRCLLFLWGILLKKVLMC